MRQLVDSGSQVLADKGFDTIQRSIKVDMPKSACRAGITQLSFPDAVSAFGFYLLFRDYHWETTNYQCMVVQVSNKEFQRVLKSNPMLISRFVDPSAVTPDNVLVLLSENLQEK